jgi:CheY-like chemotaxis protein
LPPNQRIILCVDDDPDDQMLMLETIKEVDPNARVATALNGAEALQFLERSKTYPQEMPCLVIMDINMPVLNGKEAVAKMKADKAFIEVPIVLFSTSSSSLDEDFAKQYKVPFITKSSSIKGLRETVEKLLQGIANC